MKTAIVVAVMLGVVSSAFAQTTGSIAGRAVTTADNTPIPDAAIRAKNTATGATFTALTGSDGRFSIAALPPGSYDVTADAPPYFGPFQREDVRVDAGRDVQLDVRLKDFQLETLGDGGAFFVGLSSSQPAQSGPTPRLNGRPDFSGVWSPALWRPLRGMTPAPGDRLGAIPDVLPWAAAEANRRRSTNADSPMVLCLPSGPSWQGVLTYTRIAQTAELLVIIDELFESPARQVYLDGRLHPPDPNPSFMGHSVGRWEGDTLVVDSVGFNDRAWLTRAVYPQTERMHIVERYRRPDLGHLEIEMTFDDPGAFRAPWTLKQVRAIAPKNTELFEAICNENEKDREHLKR